MKKKLLFLTTTLMLIGNLSFATPTFAESSSSKDFWTIPELIELKTTTDAEVNSLCQGDFMCEEDYRFSLLDQGGQYSALEGFSSMILMITAINPTNSTIRVLFHDEDPMMRMMGEEDRAALDEIFIAWFSEEPRIFNNYYAKANNYTQEMYYLFSGDANTNGTGWFPPNQEVEIQIEHADALLREPHLIFFAMEGENTSAYGAHGYDSCIKSPLFEEGMECRMVFDETTNFYFLPFIPGEDMPVIKDQTPSVAVNADEEPEPREPEETEESNPAEDLSTEESSNEIAPTTDSHIITMANYQKSELQGAPIAVTTVNSSNLESSTEKNEESETPADTFIPPASISKRKNTDGDFLWCIILIVALGGILIFWWVLPTRKRKENSSKKS